MLTKQQKQLYKFIQAYMKQNDGVAPSYREMADELEYAAVSNIHYMLVSMEARGVLKRIKGKARAIKLLGDSSYVALAKKDPS